MACTAPEGKNKLRANGRDAEAGREHSRRTERHVQQHERESMKGENNVEIHHLTQKEGVLDEKQNQRRPGEERDGKEKANTGALNDTSPLQERQTKKKKKENI